MDFPKRSGAALKATYKDRAERIVSRYLPDGGLSGGQEFEEHMQAVQDDKDRRKAGDVAAKKAMDEMQAAQDLKAKRKGN